MDIAEIVALSVKHNASDLHLCSGHFPHWRCNGRLDVMPQQQQITPRQLADWTAGELDERQQKQLLQYGHIDFALTQAAVRWRANLYRQFYGLSLSLRRLPAKVSSLASLRVPESVHTLLAYEEGLILITGATGSGKSTTLAAMIEAINQQQAKHIITLEDPIEYLHQSVCSLIQQREIDNHCASFRQGLLAALREDPDVILLGELRDSKTIRLALTAAETGHLVFATLHARHASQAIERLVDVFPAQEKESVRAQLAGSLQAVIAQRLLPSRTAGRVALFEVLLNTPAVANLIREGKGHQLPGVMETALRSGMLTFAQNLTQRQQAGLL
ncbi:type IV pilus twitching motility protein PilT [Enterobacteriaceae bacterium LUAb1]